MSAKTRDSPKLSPPGLRHAAVLISERCCMTTNKVDELPRNERGTSARKVSSGYLWIATAAIAGLGIAMVAPAQKMIFYNPSASAPRGWYVRVPLRDPTPGQWVLLDL